MLIFFVMLVVLLQTALCRPIRPRKQFGRDAQVYLISCPELHQQLACGLFAGLRALC
jgi:hypothetical protein